MEQKKEKNYYEILEVRPGASAEEIEDAYGKARSLYSGDSVALYSLYSSDEREEMLLKLGDIYQTLTDPARRRAYDERLIDTERPQPQTGARWDVGPVEAGRDVVEEYAETGAFRDKLNLKRPIAVMEGQDRMLLEKYRILYNRLEQISLKNSYKVFALTSSVKGEGKTMTSLNLAYVMATEFRKKVLVIECDLRNPSISSSYLDMGRLHGLIDVIKGESETRSAVSRLDDTTLYFLPARCSVKDSSVLLSTPQMRSVINTARKDFDYVIIDAPPILPLVDMNIITKLVDGLMLVVRAEKTPKDIVKKALNSLPKEKNLLGVVLNAATEMRLKKYYY